MEAMTRPRPPYLHREVARGKVYWYVRRDRKAPKIRIRGDYGSAEFMAAYHAALAGIVAVTPRGSSGSLTWAVSLYQESSAWARLAKATQRQRANILKRVLAIAGQFRIGDIEQADIRDGYEDRKAKPAAARNYLETMRGLFRWAHESGLIPANPAEGLKAIRPASEGFPEWDEDDIAAFERRWPVGTRERVAFDLLLYTGLRRGDACKIGRPHVRDGVARIKTEKTGEWVSVPIAPQLQATLDAGPCGDLAFIAGERGRPRDKAAFGEWFRGACHAAGVRKSAHGLRKAAAIRMAMNGASERELEAIFGWTGGRMASHYTRAADRERLSIGAADKLHRRK
jgi:integrase